MDREIVVTGLLLKKFLSLSLLTTTVGKQRIFCLILVITFMFMPGIIKVVFDESADILFTGVTSGWFWEIEDFHTSFLEAACALPFSECEFRPYHRRFLSYLIMNAICCFFCSTLFYPLYKKGYILQPPTFTFNPVVRIGPFDLLH